MEVKNKTLSKLFNTFDLPIRMVYSHFPLIRKLFYKKLYSSDYETLDFKFGYFKSLFDKFDIDLKGKIVLEIGPGNSLIMAYNFLICGAEKVILVDKYPLNAFKKDSNAPESFHTNKLQLEYFKKEQEFIIKKIGKNKADRLFAGIKSRKRIEFIAAGLSELKITEAVDIIISNSVFEHIKDPVQSIVASARILKKKGYALHSIDLRDHYNFNRPFLFYRYPVKTWEKYLTKLGVSYTNRIRYNDFIDMFLKAGFSILHEKKEELEQKEGRIHEQFKNRDDLSIAHVDLLLKNNKTD